MTIELLLYLAELSSSICLILSIILILFIISLIPLSLNYFCSQHDGYLYKYDQSLLYKFLSKTKKYIILLLILLCITPSSRTIYMIIGAHYLKQSKLPEKIELLIEQKLDSLLIVNNKEIKNKLTEVK